ncbi:hypothetical protein B566_EDAN002199, partial [Ephemera danica]
MGQIGWLRQQGGEEIRRRRAMGCGNGGIGLASNLGSLASDTPSQLDVLGHDGHSLSMDSTQVGVFKQADKVSLTGLLHEKNTFVTDKQQ